MRNIALDYSEDLVPMQCGECGVHFAMPSVLRDECKKRTGEKGWHCPNGHRRVFSGERPEVKLEREKEALRVQLAARDAELEMERRKSAESERRLKRTGCGVCPHCNRNFKALAAHMKSKHPTEAKSR